MKTREIIIITLFIVLVFPTCEVRETFEFNLQGNLIEESVVTLKSLTVRVLKEDGTPFQGAWVTASTYSPMNNGVNVICPDDLDRSNASIRFIADANGEIDMPNKSFNISLGPIIFSAFYSELENEKTWHGSTFLDLEATIDSTDFVLTIIAKENIAKNNGLKVGLFDPEFIMRATDFLTRENIAFDNLVYEYYNQKSGGNISSANTNWEDWNDFTVWNQILSEASLIQYDILIVGFDCSKYAEYYNLVHFAIDLKAFVKNNDDKYILICQQNISSFNWAWIADSEYTQSEYDPTNEIIGGYIKNRYELENFETATITAEGCNHALFNNAIINGTYQTSESPLLDTTDADSNSIPDILDGWSHIEPNKPEVKNSMAWHCADAETFTDATLNNNNPWISLINAPAILTQDVPADAAVIAAVKEFPNGSRILFCNATYYQGSYGPHKAEGSLYAKEIILTSILAWPSWQ